MNINLLTIVYPPGEDVLNAETRLQSAYNQIYSQPVNIVTAPLNNNTQPTDVRVCYTCKSPNHIARNCPKNNPDAKATQNKMCHLYTNRRKTKNMPKPYNEKIEFLKIQAPISQQSATKSAAFTAVSSQASIVGLESVQLQLGDHTANTDVLVV